MANIDPKDVGGLSLLIIAGAMSVGIGSFYQEWGFFSPGLPEETYAVTVGIWFAAIVFFAFGYYFYSESEDEEYTRVELLTAGLSLLVMFLYPVGILPGVPAKLAVTGSYVLVVVVSVLFVLCVAWESWTEPTKPPSAGGDA